MYCKFSHQTLNKPPNLYPIRAVAGIAIPANRAKGYKLCLLSFSLASATYYYYYYHYYYYYYH